MKHLTDEVFSELQSFLQGRRKWRYEGDVRHEETTAPRVTKLISALDAAQPERKGLTDESYEALVDDLESWSRHVVEDTAHVTLDTHIRRTLAAHGIKQGGQQ